MLQARQSRVVRSKGIACSQRLEALPSRFWSGIGIVSPPFRRSPEQAQDRTRELIWRDSQHQLQVPPSASNEAAASSSLNAFEQSAKKTLGNSEYSRASKGRGGSDLSIHPRPKASRHFSTAMDKVCVDVISSVPFPNT